MHKVVDKPDTTADNVKKQPPRSGADRDHTIKLIRILASRMDSIARVELYKRHAGERGMRGYLEVFEEARKRDLAHIEWLKEQIRRGIG